MLSKITIKHFVSFCFGFTLALLIFMFFEGILLKVPSLWDFSIFELLKFVVTVFIAVFIAYYLKNRYSDRQSQKQLFIYILNDISKAYDKPEKLVAYMRKEKKGQDERNKISLFLKKTTNKIYILTEQKEVFAIQVDEMVKKIDLEHLEIKESLMDGPNFNAGSDAFPESKIGDLMKSVNNIVLWSDQAKLHLFD